MYRYLYVMAIGVGICLGTNPCSADFVLSADPTDLVFTPGNHQVDILLTHDGTGLSTISGYTIVFGSPADASLGVLPSGVSILSASEVLPVGAGFTPFDFDLTANRAAAGNFGGNTDVGQGQTQTLFTLNFDLEAASEYEIGVDVFGFSRGVASINDEFPGGNALGTDFTFTLTAVPEPSSFVLLGGAMIPLLATRRRRNS